MYMFDKPHVTIISLASHEKVSTMYMFDKPHVTIISLASPEWISTMYMHKKRLVLLVFPACETQNLASLLSLLAVFQACPLNPCMLTPR